MKTQYIYAELNEPTLDELNQAGLNGWEVYWTDGSLYKLKRVTK